MTVIPLSPSAHAATDRLSITFDADGAPGAQLTASAPVLDASGNDNNGIVRTDFSGTVGLVSRAGGVAADFPKACASEPCPNAMVEIAERRVVLKASISVADGGWHRVTCRRAAGKLEIIIDGTKRGSATIPAVDDGVVIKS